MPNHDVYELVEAGLFRDALSAIAAQANPSRAFRILAADLEAHVGSPVRATEQAKSLLRERLSNDEVALCHEVIGRVSMTSGQLEAGLKAIRAAVSAAAQAHSSQVEARIGLSHAAALLHWGALERAAEELSKLRKACISAGDPQVLVTFHKLVAEIKAKTGLPRAARQSIEAARTLLSSWPNVAQQGFLAVTSSAIEFMQSNFEAALRHGEEALECADRSGSREILVPAIGNLAHIKLAQGRLPEARAAVTEFLSIVVKGGSTEIAGLDTQMEIALAAGDLELAASLASEVEARSAALDDGNSYHGLWNLLNQVRLRYRQGQPELGLAIALDALPRISRIADKNLLARMRLLAAEGYGRTDRGEVGATLVAETVHDDEEAALEVIGERARVAGVLAANDNQAVAIGHFRRASRIFDSIGHMSAKHNVKRDALSLVGADADAICVTDDPATTSDYFQKDGRPPSASISEFIAALLDLNEHPPLLAQEAVTLLTSTGAARRAEILCEDRTPSSRDDADSNITYIEVGEHRDRRYRIAVMPNSSPTARTTVLAIEQLMTCARKVGQARQERREQAAFWPEATPEQELGLIFGSDRMRELIKIVHRAANTPLSVLVSGETGVGKELFARAVHLASTRKDKPFLPFNCANTPKDMLDSQLFGHRKGAFTGAHEHGIGVIRAAAGGTLFLDEIGEMTLDAQPKLLRFLESGEIHPLGEPKPVQVDVRIVAATNANLDQLVSDGRFREDLYYRLNVMPIQIPPLRERREEIPALVEHFVDKFGREMQKPMIRVADETLEYLLLYRWPGNVRQLANEIRRLVALAEPGTMLTPAHLAKEIVGTRRTISVEPSEFVMRLDQPLADATDQLERAAIERALTAAGGNNEQAAKLLGLSRKGLYLKRQRLGLK